MLYSQVQPKAIATLDSLHASEHMNECISISFSHMNTTTPGIQQAMHSGQPLPDKLDQNGTDFVLICVAGLLQTLDSLEQSLSPLIAHGKRSTYEKRICVPMVYVCMGMQCVIDVSRYA